MSQNDEVIPPPTPEMLRGSWCLHGVPACRECYYRMMSNNAWPYNKLREREAAVNRLTQEMEETKALLRQVAAELRHAYASLLNVTGDQVWSLESGVLMRAWAKEFADGLIAPQIRKLESLDTATGDEP
jgi:hypothetical protein